jgi:2-C-methyl-D-erythritol 4-phosphate cytidylyltransferase
MKASAVILAAGSGDRMRTGGNKIFLPICGQAVLCHTISAFSHHPDIDELVLVVRSDEMERIRQLVQPLAKELRLIQGGETRRDSALAGVRAATKDLVLIHDGARPFPSSVLIARVVAAARRDGAAIPVLPVTDLLHKINPAGDIQPVSDLHHHALARAQTPQGFRRELILRCLDAAPPGIRDDATALLLASERVTTIPGESCNIKLTHPTDVQLAEAIATLQS